MGFDIDHYFSIAIGIKIRNDHQKDIIFKIISIRNQIYIEQIESHQFFDATIILLQIQGIIRLKIQNFTFERLRIHHLTHMTAC
jgi:hypothetical protein